MNENPNTYSRQHRTVYELRRLREAARGGAPREPEVEHFAGLDRARLKALALALDGPSVVADEFFSGTIEIHRTTYIGHARISSELVDELDERVAFRVLNELRLPRADQLALPVERLQAEANRLARLGID